MLHNTPNGRAVRSGDTNLPQTVPSVSKTQLSEWDYLDVRADLAGRNIRTAWSVGTRMDESPSPSMSSANSLVLYEDAVIPWTFHGGHNLTTPQQRGMLRGSSYVASPNAFRPATHRLAQWEQLSQARMQAEAADWQTKQNGHGIPEIHKVMTTTSSRG